MQKTAKNVCFTYHCLHSFSQCQPPVLYAEQDVVRGNQWVSRGVLSDDAYSFSDVEMAEFLSQILQPGWNSEVHLFAWTMFLSTGQSRVTPTNQRKCPITL